MVERIEAFIDVAQVIERQNITPRDQHQIERKPRFDERDTVRHDRLFIIHHSVAKVNQNRVQELIFTSSSMKYHSNWSFLTFFGSVTCQQARVMEGASSVGSANAFHSFTIKTSGSRSRAM